jgi:hypothetical protein
LKSLTIQEPHGQVGQDGGLVVAVGAQVVVVVGDLVVGALVVVVGF